MEEKSRELYDRDSQRYGESKGRMEFLYLDHSGKAFLQR